MDREQIKRILGKSKVVAVVGLSPKPHRASHVVASYLQAAGYTIIPINPGHSDILGEKAYPSLEAVPVQVDIVNVFRRSEHTPEIARQAVKIGAKVMWLQLGIENEEAKAIAQGGGLVVVMNRCIKIEHGSLF